VQWNKNISSVTFSDAENLVTCSDGAVYGCQLLIACDGIHSKIAKAALARSPHSSANTVSSNSTSLQPSSNSTASVDSSSPSHVVASHLQDFCVMNIYGRANLTNLSTEDFAFFSHCEVQV
jgi:2-polyprenyl-6-methoxyphenol hydroxylase-like FAD-dependent oxidoreductase